MRVGLWAENVGERMLSRGGSRAFVQDSGRK